MPCTVCSHPQCHDIDLALLAGSATLDALQARYGPSRSAIQRHKKHLVDKVDRAEARIDQNLRLTYLFQLNAYQEAAAATVAAARAAGNARLTIQAANSGARILTAMARLETKLGRETTYRLLAAPEWVKSGCLLPEDPNLLTGPRRSLAQGLFSACPDGDSDHLLNLHDLEEYLATALAPQDAAAPPAPRQLAFPDFLTAPAPARQTQTSPGPRDNSEIPPKRQRHQSEIKAACQRNQSGIQAEYNRHKSGIPAVQTRPPVKNILQDQIDILNDKSSAQKVAKVCKRDLPPAVLALLEEFPTPPPAVMALLADSPTPAPKTARRQPKTASAPPPHTNAANVDGVGRESEAHPAFRESDAPAASVGWESETPPVFLESTRRAAAAQAPPAFRESDAPAAIPATDAPSATAPLTAASLVSAPQPPNRQPKTVSAAAPPANAASVGGKRVHPAVRSDPPQEPPDEPRIRRASRRTGRLPGRIPPIRPSAAPPAVPASAAPPALPEPTRRAAAAQASDATTEHPPPDFFITAHKRPASFPLPAAPCPSDPSIPDPSSSDPGSTGPEPRAPNPAHPGPQTQFSSHENPPGSPSGPGRPPNFGNPGLFRQIKGTFC